MDGTLLTNHDYELVPRPHLKEFFHYAFSHFEHVSIWTHAMDEWFLHAFHNLLKEYIPLGEEFHFVWTREKCVVENTVVRKPLDRVYSVFEEYNSDNTFIVDDNVDTYVYNRKNAIGIGCFNGDPEDCSLLMVMEHFDSVVFANSPKYYDAFEELPTEVVFPNLPAYYAEFEEVSMEGTVEFEPRDRLRTPTPDPIVDVLRFEDDGWRIGRPIEKF
jgi:hypothetical protein